MTSHWNKVYVCLYRVGVACVPPAMALRIALSDGEHSARLSYHGAPKSAANIAKSSTSTSSSPSRSQA